MKLCLEGSVSYECPPDNPWYCSPIIRHHYHDNGGIVFFFNAGFNLSRLVDIRGPPPTSLSAAPNFLIKEYLTVGIFELT